MSDDRPKPIRIEFDPDSKSKPKCGFRVHGRLVDGVMHEEVTLYADGEQVYQGTVIRR